MKSKVHPTYKTKYRVANWPAYNQALVRRGDVTVWVSAEATAAWTPRRSGRRGGDDSCNNAAGRHAGRLTGGAPRRAPAADGDAVAVEDQRAVGVAARPPSREGLGNGVRDRENPPHQRLRAGGREPDDAAGLVDLVPGEAEDLVLAPAGVVGEVEDVLPRGGQVGAGSVTSRRGTGMLLDVSCCLSMNCQRPRVERSGSKAAILLGA